MTQRQSQVNVFEANQAQNETLLGIKAFAQVCRTTVRTVRFYDIKGLLKPFKIDEWTKYRYYKPDQARDFLKIRFMQSFGIPLSQIKELLTINAQESYLEEKLGHIEDEIEEREKQLRFLTNLRELLFEDKKLNKVFERQKIGPFNLFCFKVEHGSYDSVNIQRQKIRDEAKKLGIATQDHDLIFYLEPEYKPKDTRLEFALICKKDYSKQKPELSEGFYFRDFPKTSSLTYDYQGLNTYFIIVYQRLFEILEESGIKLKGNEFDINMEEPFAKISPYDYRTKLVFPL